MKKKILTLSGHVLTNLNGKIGCILFGFPRARDALDFWNVMNPYLDEKGHVSEPVHLPKPYFHGIKIVGFETVDDAVTYMDELMRTTFIHNTETDDVRKLSVVKD